MITRDDIRELATFHSPEACALTFYYQPSTPLNRTHREDSILVKDLIRDALREVEKNGSQSAYARTDLKRINDLLETLHGNGGKAKAIFACSQQNFWREFDVPAQLPKTNLIFNQRFHLKPLASVLDGASRSCIVIADRAKARIFEMVNNDIVEKQDFVNFLPHRVKSDGWGGYDGGHAERSKLNEAMVHFKTIADYITGYFERGECDRLLIGCADELWPEIHPHLHPYAKQRLVGHFRINYKLATPEEVKQLSQAMLRDYEAERKQNLIREVIDEAHGNRLGAIGLRRVLRSLELGEVQTLLLASNFQAPGVKCYHCGHMDYHVSTECVVCGKPNTNLEDIGDAIVGYAIRGGIEIVYIQDDEQFDRIGRIGALLRFRAEQSTPAKMAV
jgi:peptide subunit release factor 1 (eRF1)